MSLHTIIAHAVDRIAALPGAVVDCGFGQGYDAIRAQYERLVGESLSDLYIDGKFIDYHDVMGELVAWVAPYHFPEDYRIFIQDYGGLAIAHSNDTYLTVFGFGPMCEEWYSYVQGDDRRTEPQRDGLLHVASLSLESPPDQFHEVAYCIDLHGRFAQGAVIRIAPWHNEGQTLHELALHPETTTDSWRVVAPSFAEWLVIVGTTYEL